jgi:PAS domain S-box-containing protein
MVFNNVPLGIMHFDGGGRVTACNEPLLSILGIHRQILIGWRLLELTDPHIVSAVKNTLDGNVGHYEVTLRAVTADKRMTPVMINFAPIASEAGEITGGVGIVQDLTEQKQIERVFLHDIMNTAMAIQGFSELIAEGADSDEERSHFISRIHSLSNKIVDEINTHRHLITTERADIKLDIKTINTREFIKELYDAYNRKDILTDRRKEGQADRLLTIAEDCAETEFKSDKTLLGRVLGNMIKNAVEASEGGQTVTVGCREEGDKVAFWVHNQTRIAPEIQEQLFSRSVTTKGTGRGLGTYSMKNLTEKYLKGEISFSSTESEGTTYIVRYPR